MKKLSIVLIAMLLACGPRIANQNREVDSELEEFVSSFEKELGHSISFKVTFMNATNNLAGICHRNADGTREVDIVREFFDKTSYFSKEQVMFHELGHCELWREHNETFIFLDGRSVPQSIMFPYAFDNDELVIYEKYRQQYINELFGRQ